MSNGPIMSEKEARELLGLPKSGALDKGTVESEFIRMFRMHQAHLNSAWVKEDRIKKEQILLLLKQAKNICLGVSGKGSQSASGRSSSTSSTATYGRQNASAPRRHRSTGTHKVYNMGKQFRYVFCHIWMTVKSLFCFICSIPGAFIEVKDFVLDTLDNIEAHGIPKFVTVLVLILGLAPLFGGCVQVIQKVSEWLR
jgi:hypothetical protein